MKNSMAFSDFLNRWNFVSLFHNILCAHILLVFHKKHYVLRKTLGCVNKKSIETKIETHVD